LRDIASRPCLDECFDEAPNDICWILHGSQPDGPP
jgi:hypothetical protein